MADVPFEALMRLLRVKSSSYINEFVEKLKSDNSKFVPIDGNVHPITVNVSHLVSFCGCLSTRLCPSGDGLLFQIVHIDK